MATGKTCFKIERALSLERDSFKEDNSKEDNFSHGDQGNDKAGILRPYLHSEISCTGSRSLSGALLGFSSLLEARF